MLVDDYIQLLDRFLEGQIDAVAFEGSYQSMFKAEQRAMSDEAFSILDRLFAEVDAFCADATLRDEHDLDEGGLMQAARRARHALETLREQSRLETGRRLAAGAGLVDALPLAAIPAFVEWKASDPAFDWPGFLFATSSIEGLFSASRLFWPALREHGGGVFLADWFDASLFDEWMAKLGGDVSRVEHVMNRRWVNQLVHDTGDMPAEHLHHLGRIIAECWRARLDKTCGAGHHEVLLTFSEEDEECSLTFHRRV